MGVGYILLFNVYQVNFIFYSDNWWDKDKIILLKFTIIQKVEWNSHWIYSIVWLWNLTFDLLNFDCYRIMYDIIKMYNLKSNRVILQVKTILIFKQSTRVIQKSIFPYKL